MPSPYHSEQPAPDAIPCPWCGCDAMKVFGIGREHEARTYYVACTYDGCDGGGITGPRRLSAREAIDSYNEALVRVAMCHA